MIKKVLQGLLSWLGVKIEGTGPLSIYEKGPVTDKKTLTAPPYEIHSIWDHIRLRENTQAYYICQACGYEEWTEMGEIMRRVEEIFKIKIKNERSLYPYLKTLVDVGLFENNTMGGRMRWRKKETLIQIPVRIEKQIVEEIKKKNSPTGD